MGQSFQNATAGQLVKAKFAARKVGTPTGNAVVRLYAHTGTFGSGGTPTGAVLVSSSNFDVSTLTASMVEYEIAFEATEFYDLLGSSTAYFVVFDAGGITGDGSNNVRIGYDGSAPTGSGNAATEATAGGWTAQTYDLAGFEVWRDGEVQVNSSGGSNPATSTNSGSPSSATVIINSVTFTVSDIVAGSEVQIRRTSDDALLAFVESSGTSLDYSYNYGGDTPVYVIVQKLTHKWRRFNSTLLSTDRSVPANQQTDPDYANP